MGWSESEKLVVVLEDGTIRLYDINGEYTQLSLVKVSSNEFTITIYTTLE